MKFSNKKILIPNPSSLHHLLKNSPSLSQLKQIHALVLIIIPFHSLLHNILIQSYSKSPSSSQESLLLFRHLLLSKHTLNPSLPDEFTYTFAITSSSQQPTSQTGESIHALSIKSGFTFDTHIGNSLINLYSNFRKLNLARDVFDEMSQRDVVTWTSLIKAYTKTEQLGMAQQLFDEMPHRNVVSWTVMIAGYVNAENYNEALHLFNDMLIREKESPNEAILVCVLLACAHLGALDQGKWIHAYIDKNKLLQGSSNISTVLINMYAKCGSLDCAKQVFSELSRRRDVMTWTSMISGLALHGLGTDALSVFRRMVDDGVRPDSVTLLGVLNACSHSGLVDQGCDIFYSMKWSWGVVPKIEHNGCLIDLLGRAGQVEKALAIVLKLPIEPDIVIWRALLSACRTHGNAEIGQQIIDHIAKLDISSKGGGQVLLSNLYASVERWDEVVKVRNRMDETSRGSSPGCSWIEIDGVVHEFLVADKLHPRIEEIRRKLGEVLREVSMKGGYVANTKNVLFDLSEEDREQAVYWHSEKLAVAFGLMSLDAGSPVRIVKNLRICEDCHAAMKAISHVFGREIVVRDRSRFHTFREGSCSCMDYW